MGALFLVLAGAGIAPAQPMANSPESARTLLSTRYELTPVDGNHWLLPAELRLRELLGSLPAKLEAYDAAEQAMQRAGPYRGAESPEVAAAASELLTAQQNALVAILEVEQLKNSLPELYAPLRENEEVSAELARVGGLLEDRTPITFVLDQHSSTSWITSNDLQRAGLELSPNAPTGQLTIDLGQPNTEVRTLEVVELHLPPLRFGDCVLTGVSVWVLPPEGENYGSHLSVSAFESNHFTVEWKPSALQLQITPAE